MCLDHRFCSISTEEAMNSIAVEVKPLIQTYKELFRDKLRLGLPPKRIVDHQIKLIPNTQPFNQHSYRMNQVELDALRKQLDGLLEPSVHRIIVRLES